MRKKESWREPDWWKKDKKTKDLWESVGKPAVGGAKKVNRCDCGCSFYRHPKCKECTKLLHGDEKCDCLNKDKQYISQKIYYGLTD